MASLRELIELNKYQSGYHGDGKQAHYASSAPAGLLNPDHRQAVALKLMQFKAQLDKAQADAAIAKRKQDLWNMVGTPAVSDKSTAGDVSQIVDTEKVGGRDANVSNRGDSFLKNENYQGQDPALLGLKNQDSGSTLVNMVKSLQPTISSAGNMILTKPKPTKPQDQVKTFSYAKRLADQSIIDSGKTRKDISSDEYKTLIDSNLPQAEKFLYGKTSNAATDNSSSVSAILQRPAKQKSNYQGAAKRYDEARTFQYAKRLADQSILQSGKRKRDISPEDYKTLVNDNIPQAEKFLYGRVLSQPDQKVQPNAATDPTGVTGAAQTAMDLGKAPDQNQNPAYEEGQTAVNQKTGKRLIFKGGRWVPLN